MEEYIGLKRSRKYEITETEEVLGINKDGFLEIKRTRFDPVVGLTHHSMRRLTRDGEKVHLPNHYNFDEFVVPEQGGKLVNGGWDNNWPDVLKRKWPEID